MDEIKRYDMVLCHDQAERSNGEWVRYTDHIATVDALNKRIDMWKIKVENLLTLVDGAKTAVELFDPDGGESQKEWKRTWLEKTREIWI